MIIRTATVSDLGSLAALYAEFFLEDGIATPRSSIERNLRLMLDDSRASIFVAETGGSIAGFSSGSITYGIEFGCAAELEDLYVRPDYRGRGLSKRLVTAVLDWSKDQGATETILIITPEAEAAQSLTRYYDKFGFRDSRRITMYRKNSDTDV